MYLINWKIKNRNYEIETVWNCWKALFNYLKKDGSNFIKWKDDVSKCCENTRLIEILAFGSEDPDTPHPVHSLFAEVKNFFDIYSEVTLEQVKSLAKERTSGSNEIKILINNWLCSCIFASVESKL